MFVVCATKFELLNFFTATDTITATTATVITSSATGVTTAAIIVVVVLGIGDDSDNSVDLESTCVVGSAGLRNNTYSYYVPDFYNEGYIKA